MELEGTLLHSEELIHTLSHINPIHRVPSQFLAPIFIILPITP
jgi:hypothetical protein